MALGDYLRQENFDAEAEAREIGALLTQLGGTPVTWDVEPEERDLARVDMRLKGWARPEPVRNGVLLWIGHGTSNGQEAVLFIRGHSSGTDDSEFPPAAFAEHVKDARRLRSYDRLWDIVVVEACGAARFVEAALGPITQAGLSKGLLLVGSGRDEGSGHLGTFRRTLEHILTHVYGDHDTVITVSGLAKHLDDAQTFYVSSQNLGGLPPLRRRTPLAVTTSVENHARLREALQSLSEEERTHFARKGLGSEFGELTWCFAGRGADRTVIGAWLSGHHSGVLVVTGRAGCGKSALLGSLLLHAHARFVELLPLLSRAHLTDGEDEESLDLPTFDATIHLAGATTHDITARLSKVFDVELPPDILYPAERSNALIQAVRSRPDGDRTFTLLVDALDEAHEPPLIARLLRELGTLPGIRILVGTRASSNERVGSFPRADEDLLDALGVAEDHVQVHRLRRDPQALTDFVTRSLERARADFPESRENFQDAVRRAAVLIVGDGDATADRDFLYATLAVHEILADPGLLLAERVRELAGLLLGDHRTLFTTTLRRLAAQHPRSPQLLEALAHAQGRGLPRADRIWATAATALGSGPDNAVGAQDIDEVLEVAAPYIMLDGEDGQSVHRLAHRTFAEYFTQIATDDVSDRARRITVALVRLADEDPGQPLNPYLARHLSGHAAAVGTAGWAALAERPAVLDRLSVPAMATDVLRAVGMSDRLPPSVLGVLDAAYLLRRGGPADRVGLRQLGTTRAAGLAPVEERHPGAESAGWQVCWARLRPRPSRLTLARHAAPVRSLAAVTGADGSTRLAGVDDDGNLHVWDPSCEYAATTAASFATGPVTTVTALPGRALVATSGHDKCVRIWDLSSERPKLRHKVESGMWPHALHGYLVPRTAGDNLPDAVPPQEPEVAIGEYGGAIRFLDPLTGHVGQRCLRSQGGAPVWALTTFTDGTGSMLLASVADNGIQVWDTVAGRRRGDAVRRAGATARAVVAFERPDGGGALVAGGWDDGGIEVWDPVTGDRAAAFVSDGPVHALAALTLVDGNRPLLAAVMQDGAVRVWDALTGEMVEGAASQAEKEDAHSNDPDHQGLAIVAFEDPGGDTLLATSTADGTVSVWHPHPRHTVGDPEAPAATDPHAERIVRLTTVSAEGGRTLLLAEGHQGTLAAYDALTGERVATPADQGPAGPPPAQRTTRLTGPDGLALCASYGRSETFELTAEATGRRYGTPLRAHQDWVTDVVAFTTADGRHLVVSCADGRDCTVRFWDPVDPTGPATPAGPAEPVDRAPLYTLSLDTRCFSLASLGDGRLAIGTDEGVLVVRMESWLLTGRTEGRRPRCPDRARAVSGTPRWWTGFSAARVPPTARTRGSPHRRSCSRTG
ncbi:WD40 repeat domain-containing protein [Streptomyces sp. PTD9-10]|uniref:WD40 repeat domain-containing protein n=1 Tax=Streptomyces sp. PTD9-10 TaxID=3120151 RepID=UPI00300990D1